ncbi:major capsid protein [Caudoviricetes sp.]|nr:major capsid protein [Caudoviricetes sp.]
MAIASGTITRYDGYRAVREDLANVIYNISPVDVPFMSNIGRENVKNTYFEWQTDALAAASTTNAQLEGDDSFNADSRSPTQRVGNYTQISRKVIEVTGTLEAVDKAGMRSYLAYELAKAASELKRDMESTLTSNQVAVAGGNTTARKTAGLGGWIITNSYSGTGTTASAPVMSSGAGNLDGYPTTASVAGASRALTETLLKTAIQGVWTQGGDPKMCMVGPYNKTVVSGFTGIATRYRDVAPGKQAEIIGAADVYVSDFGTVNIVPNRFQPENNAYLVDPEYAAVGYLRNFRTEVLAKTGDAEKRMIIVEYGLKVRQQKSMAAIRDLATS